MSEISISSDAFKDGGQIPKKYGYKNENRSPPLVFSGAAPPGTKSLALVMDDPDAVKPAGKVWSHWIVWNILPDVTRIPEDSVPKGAVEGVTDFGSSGYGGPAPPDAEHTYVFALYALDATLDLPPSATKQQLEQAIKPHVISKAELRGKYSPD